MEVSKCFSVNTDYKDRRSSPSWQTRIFAEVILVDKTLSALHPRIYRLKDNVVPTSHQIQYWKSGAITLPDEAFDLVGEALVIDKKKKQVLLTNENTISYNYLIIASGTKPLLSFENRKFLAAIQALIDALRVKQKIPYSFAKHMPMLSKVRSPLFSVQQQSRVVVSEAIKSIVQPQMCQAMMHKNLSQDCHSINKRLYEVHL